MRPVLSFFIFCLAGMAAARADTWVRPAISADEVAQGYRDDVVMAKPKAAHVATVDSEEQTEGVQARITFPRFGGLRALPVRAGETPAQAVERLQATGRYEFVSVDHLRHAFATVPGDPQFSQQWHLSNNGTNSPASGPGIPGADLHATAAWDIRHDASSILVATCDTGLRLTHQDIIANLWTNPTAGKDGFLNDLHGIDSTVAATNAGSGTPNDTDGHGTHVAGIIGAVGDNGLNVSGVAWHVQIMALKFLGANGGSSADEAVCLNYAIAHGVKIINASFGADGPDSTELTALQGLRNAGIIMVCAAGNTSEDNDLSPSFPANYPLDNLVSVAASDNRDDLVFFSSYGSGDVDLAAPGYNILSLYNTSDTATTLLSGTSMATPMVTGSLALLEAQFPGDTYRQTINRLLRHVDLNPNFAGKVLTGGRLNLAASLGSAANDNTPFNDSFASRGHLSGTTFAVRASNTGATREAGEPTIAGNAGGASLWWEWTAPYTGAVTLSTTENVGGVAFPSGYATLIGAYTGTSVSALTPVAGVGGTSATFGVQAGTTYEFTVDGQNGATGLTLLTLAYANDTFQSPLPLGGNSFTVTGSNLNATAQTGEPKILGKTVRHSLWYSWTAPKSGPYEMEASSADFDPLLAVYTGAAFGSLTTVNAAAGAAINASADTPVSNAAFNFTAAASTTYLIQVDGATDANDTGLNAGQFTLSLVDARWAAAGADAFRSSPAVGTDGTVYIGGDDDTVYAFNPDGTGKWTYKTGGSIDSSSPAIAPDGTVYVSCDDGNLYALTSAGALKWKFPVPNAGTAFAACSPAIATDGTVYFKDSVATLFAVNPDGSQKWTASVPGESYAAPSIAADGTIYLGSDDGKGDGMLYAFTPAGAGKWAFDAQNPIYTAAAIDASGNLYFGTLGGTVFGLSSQGKQLWTYQAGGSISSAPALGASGALYFGGYDHKLYALSTGAGALQWTAPLGGEVRASAPAIDANGLIYIGAYDGLVYAVNPNGSINRTYATAQLVRSSPAIFGTTLYFASADFHLYACDIGASSTGSAWPAYMGGTRRLGRAVTEALAITAQPTSSVGLVTGQAITLSVAAVGQGPLNYQWQFNGQNIAGATNSTFVIPLPTPAVFGSYTAVVSGPQGSVTSAPSMVGPLVAPAIATQPQSQTVTTGSNVTLSAAATGGNLSYQWAFNGVNLAGATGSTLTLSNIGAQQGAAYGSYTVLVTNSLGNVLSSAASVTVTTNARLLNISSSGTVTAGSNAALDYLVAGFAIGPPSTTKQILVRGVGPALTGFGIATPLTSPTLTLFNASGTQAGINSGWSSGAAAATVALSSAFAQTGAFSLPSGSADSALLLNLQAGTYSAQISSANSSGVALAEVYDADTGTPAGRLLNISSRANVGAGSGVLSAGFVIAGSTSETILLRGIGPTLQTSFGITGALTQPSLTLFDKSNHVIGTNTGWGGDITLSAVFANVGAFALPGRSADAALLATLAPGQYTAQLSGAGNTSGVGLIEVYEVR